MPGDSLPRDILRLVEPRPSGADYTFIALTPTALAALARHPRRETVIDAMEASGRISEKLADELRERCPPSPSCSA